MKALTEAIELWADHWNDDPKPFIWHKAADEIIEKVRRGRLKLHRKARRTVSYAWNRSQTPISMGVVNDRG